MHYRYNRPIQSNRPDTGRTSGHPHTVMITHTICSFIFYSVIVICYACLLMLLYFVMRIMIVTHDTHGIKLTPARCAEPWFGYSPNAEYVGEEHLGHPDQAGPSYQGQ